FECRVAGRYAGRPQRGPRLRRAVQELGQNPRTLIPLDGRYRIAPLCVGRVTRVPGELVEVPVGDRGVAGGDSRRRHGGRAREVPAGGRGVAGDGGRGVGHRGRGRRGDRRGGGGGLGLGRRGRAGGEHGTEDGRGRDGTNPRGVSTSAHIGRHANTS